MSRNIARTIKRFGACYGKVEEYAKYGDDFEKAMRHANADDVDWFLERLVIHKSIVIKQPRQCRAGGCTDSMHYWRYQTLRERRRILRQVWAGRVRRKY